MGSIAIGYNKAELEGLRVVRGPDWEWDTQDGGEGFVGTVVKNLGLSWRTCTYITPKSFASSLEWNLCDRRVKVRWDSGQEFIYRIGAEGAYDLRVLDNSAVGVKHPGVECRGCGQKDIAGLRWQCFDCPSDLCTVCFTNRNHDERHVNFIRYDRPFSDPMVVRLHSDQPRIPLKGFFPGALVGRGVNWIYDDEDGGSSSFGKVVPAPTGREMTPGKVWVQWPHEVNKSYPYRVGFSGKLDLEMAKAGIGGQYQPDTLPVLVISKHRANEKTNDVIADHPFVVGDRVKVVVGLEELREMSVDCELNWNAGKMKKVVKEILIIKEIDNKNNTAKVVLANENSALYDPDGFWMPVKAIRRLIPWLPVGAVVQVNDESLSSDMDMAHVVMAGDFGRVKQVSLDGKTVDMEFFTSDGNVTRTVSVSRLQKKFVDVSMIEKVESVRTDLAKNVESIESILSKLMLLEVIEKLESVRKELAKLLLSEVEKESILSVQFLLKTYPDIINCQSPYNGRNSTALSVACQKGNVEMVKLLLTHKASVEIADEEDKEEDYDEPDEDDVTEALANSPVYYAVLGNHPEVLRLLLQNGASPNVIWNFKTSLHLAAMKGHVACVRVLLEDERCDLDFEDFSGDRAFRSAVESSIQSVELFNLFRDTGKFNIYIEKYAWRGGNLLHLAAKYNNLGAAKVLLSCPEGKKLAFECDDSDRTPLFIACYNGRNQIAKLLVSNVDKDENGKPWGIDAPNEEGKTPLMRVVEWFNYELIEFLIGAGANLQAIDKKGDTSFHYAARLYREKEFHSDWPNQETAPEIFKLYNELETKHPDENIPPIVAIIYYLVAKGGIPRNFTLPEFKKLVGDNFLYDDEIIHFFPDQFNSMSQNVGNPSQSSQPAGWSERNGKQPKRQSITQVVAVGAVHQNTLYGCNEDSNSSLEDLALASTSDQDTEMVTGESVSSISPRQQSNTFHSSPYITSENVPGTVTPTGTTGYGFIPATTHVPYSPYMGETISSDEGSMSIDQPSADTPNADLVATGSARPPEEVTCTIEEKHFHNRRGGKNEKKTSLIIIDESGRRYSQQKKDVSDIFQCTANVSTPNKPNGSKKCKGTIDVQDLAGKVEEWKTNPEKKFTFKVRNAHEEHLPSKKGRQSTETESNVPSTSKRKKKT